VITDENWIKNYFIPEIKKTMLAAVMASKDQLYKNPGVYEMFGVDLILDENLKLHVIEINPSPMIISNLSKKTKILNKMSKGMFNIVKA
jgi:D-alanine-D-alanine ligase-like ATP-grasp enzyme